MRASSRSFLSHTALLMGCLCLFACTTAGGSRDAAMGSTSAQAVNAHRAWWQAYASGDVAGLEARTAMDATATFSGGVTLSRAELMAAAGKNRGAPGVTMSWSDESVQSPRSRVAVVSATSTESAGTSVQAFRMLAVLETASDGDWRMLRAQSTRVARFAPAVAASVSGPLAGYAGRYRTLKGRELVIELRGDVLTLVEPDGKALPLTPTGPGLFEPTAQSPLNGVLRFVFARDAAGAVTSFSRLTEGRVDTFPRIR